MLGDLSRHIVRSLLDCLVKEVICFLDLLCACFIFNRLNDAEILRWQKVLA